MDQIISYMPRQLIHFDDGEVLTSAMVNNYIKDGLVPRADGKRYGPIHLGYLTAVCALKRVLSVRDMKVLISAGEKREKPPEELYAYFLQALDRALNETAQSLPPQAAPRTCPAWPWTWPCAAMPASWPVHASWISFSPRARRPQKGKKVISSRSLRSGTAQFKYQEVNLMSDFIILTDSSADLSGEMAQAADAGTPLTFTIGGADYHNYPDNREMDPHLFYQRLRAGEVATTAAVNMNQYVEAIEPLLQAGRDVLVLAFSSGLSATFQSSKLAVEELRRSTRSGSCTLWTPCAPPWARGCWCGTGRPGAEEGPHHRGGPGLGGGQQAAPCATSSPWMTCTSSSGAGASPPPPPWWAPCSRSSLCSTWTTRGTSSTSARPGAARPP